MRCLTPFKVRGGHCLRCDKKWKEVKHLRVINSQQKGKTERIQKFDVKLPGTKR